MVEPGASRRSSFYPRVRRTGAVQERVVPSCRSIQPRRLYLQRLEPVRRTHILVADKAYFVICPDRWIAVRVDIMGTLLSAILAAYLVYSARVSASNAGFAMNMAGTLNVLFSPLPTLTSALF